MTHADTVFFPEPILGWVFISLLLAVLISASYVDAKHLIIPKWLSLPTLAIGLVFNVIRGAWLGASGFNAWQFGGQGTLIGAADGLLFGLAGAVLGFLLFFFLWIFKTCGGGDVKFFAALGAWIGPNLAVWVLAGTIGIVALIVAAKTIWRLLRRLPAQEAGADRSSRDRVVSFSLPVSIATLVVVCWSYRHELLVSPTHPAIASRALRDGR